MSWIGSSKSKSTGRVAPEANQANGHRMTGAAATSCIPRASEHCDLTYRNTHSPPTMSTLHRFAASSLRATARPALSQRAPALVRHEATVHNPGMAAGGQKGRPAASLENSQPTSRHGESEMIRQEGPREGMPNHNPDYNVATDYRVS